jgi:serine/threonine-protein kinase RsbW
MQYNSERDTASRQRGPFMILHTTAELNNLGMIRRFVEESALSLSADEHTAYALVQAVDECVTNIIEHGYRLQPGSIDVEIERANETLTIVLRDHAPPFDPTGVPPPDLARPLEEREPGGLGIYLTRQMVDHWQYRALPEGGNELTLFKNIKPTQTQA